MNDVFEAIATPVRRAILDELVERDGQTLFELCGRLAMKHQLGLTRQAISQHLEVLESSGLVTTVRQGKYKLHHVHTAPLKAIVERWLKLEVKDYSNENRRNQHLRRRSRKGVEFLHNETRLRQKKRRPAGHS